jgi:ABC-type glutathione transport system ATPase component
LLEARHLVRRYPARGGAWRSGAETVAALDGASLALHSGEVLGLVGRSGSGKSTMARVMLALERPDSGEVVFRGRVLAAPTGAELEDLRRNVQAVFQDPHGALDPRQRIGSAIAEPLVIRRVVPASARRGRVAALLRQVGLPAEGQFLRRLPAELSGGERQRVALARALAGEPKAIVLDEPVSALDVSVRGQVLNLLLELQRSAGTAMLVITHDIGLVARLCDRVAVMAGGRVVEEGPPEVVLRHPRSEATAELLAAARVQAPASPF